MQRMNRNNLIRRQPKRDMKMQWQLFYVVFVPFSPSPHSNLGFFPSRFNFPAMIPLWVSQTVDDLSESS